MTNPNIDRLLSEMERALRTGQVDASSEIRSCIPDYGEPSEEQAEKLARLTAIENRMALECEWE